MSKRLSQNHKKLALASSLYRLAATLVALTVVTFAGNSAHADTSAPLAQESAASPSKSMAVLDHDSKPNADASFEMAAPVSDLQMHAHDFKDAGQNLNLDTLSASQLLLSGMENAQSDRLDIAIKQFEEVIRREPENVSAHNNLAVCLKRQGNNKAALEEFKQAIQNNPTRCELFNNLAHSYIADGQYDLAVESLYKALRLNPDFAEAHRNLGHVLALKGDNDAAVTAFQEALRDNPQMQEVRIDMGDSLRALHRYEPALLEYKTAQKSLLGKSKPALLPRDIELRLAKCYEGLGETSQAHKILSNLLEANPDDTDALNCLGVVLWKMNHLPEAVFVLERALKVDASYPQARNNLGIVLYQLKRYDEAVDVWRQAIGLKPDYPEAHYNMGVALYQSGLLQQSTEAYKECLKYAPLDANAHNNLGLALWRSDQKTDAIAEWRKAIDCDANMAEAFTNLGRALHRAGTSDNH
ncbi:tetratricopeptide repeat protein [soil metagenome]